MSGRVQINISLLSSVVTLVALGCAPDRSQSSYRSQQAQANYQQYKAVATSYSGSANSALDGQQVGSAQLTLQATLNAVPSADGLGQEQQAGMSGILVIKGLRNTSMTFTTISYDPDQHTISAQPTITDYSANSSTAVQKINLFGTINNGQFSGHVEIQGMDSYGLLIETQAQTNSIASIYSASSLRVKQLSVVDTIYHGQVQIPAVSVNGNLLPATTAAVEMSFSSQPASELENFFDLLSSRRLVMVVLTTKGGSVIEDTLNLTGYIEEQDSATQVLHVNNNSQAATGVPKVELDCTSGLFPSGATSAYGWSCTKKTHVGSTQFVVLP